MRKWIFLLVALLLLLSPLVGGCGAKKYELTISVSPSGGGTTSPAVGTHKYDKDASVTITATAATGYQFVNWTGDASGTTATATVTMTSDKSVSANFAKIQYTLTIAKVGNGTTNPAVGTHPYDAGTAVSITATADSGWHFVNWSGDATGTTATVSVTMSANKTVTANFALSTYTLTMAKVGNGTIDPDVGAHTYNAATVVDLTATADSGWRFVNWTGDATGTTATVSVTMSANKTVTANFVQLFTLTIAVSPAGGGTTNPAAGTYTKDAGTAVSITATPASGYEFANWTGGVTGTNATISVTMNANKSVTANFAALVTYTLSMAVEGNGTTDPAVGDHVSVGGTVVNITATPDEDWYFVSWTGDVVDPNSEATTVTVNADKTVTASFTDVGYTLTMDIDDASHGSVSPEVGDHVYGEGRIVNITATPASGWKFDIWTGDTSGVDDETAASTTILVDSDYYIMANFVEIPTYTLTMDVDDSSHGTTDPAVGDHPYLEGTVVTITAHAASGWQFDSWTGDVDTVDDVTAASTTVQMDGDYYITANFVEI